MLDSALKASPPELQGQLNYIIAQLGSTDDQWPGEYASDDEGVEEEENEVIICSIAKINTNIKFSHNVFNVLNHIWSHVTGNAVSEVCQQF